MATILDINIQATVQVKELI